MAFFLLCKQCKLSYEEMDQMTIGMCLEYVEEYLELHSGNKKESVRNASQNDFDSF